MCIPLQTYAGRRRPFLPIKNLYGSKIGNEEALDSDWLGSAITNAAHGWLGFSPRKANNILRPPGSRIAFREDSTVTKTELICAKT